MAFVAVDEPEPECARTEEVGLAVAGAGSEPSPVEAKGTKRTLNFIDSDISRSKVYFSVKTGSHLNLHRLKYHRTT